MTEATTDRRSPLTALKVPFDLKGLALGAVIWVVLLYALRYFTAESMAGSWFNLPWHGTGWRNFWSWEMARDGVVLLAVAALPGLACCRIAAMRLARDEGVDLAGALGFAVRNLGATLGAYLFLAGALLLFSLCVMAGGWLSTVPVVGVVIVPLAMLGTLLFYLLLVGTVFGLPLVLPGLATERNGALDAVSRSFSYAFGRPALWALYGLTVWFFTGLLLTVAQALPGLMVDLLRSGMPLDPAATGPLDPMARGPAAFALEAAARAATNFSAPDFAGVESAHLAFGWAAWIGLTLMGLILRGWAIYYLFGGMTAAYFALRHDVDGTEDEELWVEGESEEDLGPPEEPVREDASPA